MSRLLRMLRIAWTVVRYRLDASIARFAGRRWWLKLSPLGLLPRPRTADAVRFRRALEDLGPVFVKLGQILSTRRDLLPTDYADELAKLQDRVPPFDGAIAVDTVERALGAPIDELFAHFDPEPLASASLAQVHTATLPQGDAVVVKVIRPDIERVIESDIRLIHTIANLLERLSRDARRLHLKAVVTDYEATIFGELNLLKEADNTATLRRNFAGSPLLYAPQVYWERCAESVLVLERIHGIPIADVAALQAAGTDMKKLAERGVETFFTQVFQHNFFHADMHPGNIFINAEEPASPSYIAVDCAIIGRLTDEDQWYIARNVLAFLNRDYLEIARLHVRSGWVPDDTDTLEFAAVIRQLGEPLFMRPLKDISFGHFLVALFTTARRFDMEVQPQLVLLQKTLLNIEGMGRELYPDLDLWSTAKPFMERWVAERHGPKAILKAIADHAPAIVAELPRLPAALAEAPTRLAEFDRRLDAQRRSLQRLAELEATSRKRARRRRLAGAVLLAVLGVVLWREVSPEAAAAVVAGAVALLLVLR
ncbi:MAG: ubiquinone biosynthesis regulatory protein kinase UbiB [Gammaproteobacteria bacterium]|nr:ubiquinone biosynthesis regulatory protein kinase UbiB [Gammaproteobacteria bacterium]